MKRDAKPKFRVGQVVRIIGEWRFYRRIRRIDEQEVWLIGGEAFSYKQNQLCPLTAREIGPRKGKRK
jgi:SH3-like domain-containing protein